MNPKLQELIEPVVSANGLDLFDIDQHGSTLVITVDRDGGVDLDELAAVTRALSRVLDDADPIPGRYTLEVSSPGLERKLREPRHFAWAKDREVSVKMVATFEGDRRIKGIVTSADDTGIVVMTETGNSVRLEYREIDKAHTVFEWGPAPKPGSKKGRVEAK